MKKPCVQYYQVGDKVRLTKNNVFGKKGTIYTISKYELDSLLMEQYYVKFKELEESNPCHNCDLYCIELVES